MGYKITVDGYAATGKGTLTKALASELNMLYVDTGMIYRTYGLYTIREKIDISNIEEATKKLLQANIRLDVLDNVAKAYIGDEDVSTLVRTEQVAAVTAKVAKIKSLRECVLKIQRDLGEKYNVIMEGRDIGSEVFPNAELKLFLTADADERAKRRYKELIEKGKETTYEEVRTQIINRDKEDTTREISPLRKTDDMIEIDTTNLTIPQVLDMVKELINKKGLGCF